MNIIYFAEKNSLTTDPFFYAINKRFSHVEIDVYTKKEDLLTKVRLKHFPTNTIIILRAISEAALIDIYFICHHLRSFPSILILPDADADTVALGLRTKMHFLFHGDSPVDDIVFVAEQFLDEKQKVIALNGKRMNKHESDFFDSPSRGGFKVSNQ